MEESNDKNDKNTKPIPSNEEPKISRRNIIKGLGAISVLGAFGYQFSKSLSVEKLEKKNVLSQLGFSNNLPNELPKKASGDKSETLRIGIIGTGPRGLALLESLGFSMSDSLTNFFLIAHSLACLVVIKVFPCATHSLIFLRFKLSNSL